MSKKRCRVFIILIFIIFSALSVRIFSISVINNASFSKMAFSQQTVVKDIRKIRGTIYDSLLIPMTDSKTEKKYLGKNGEISNGETEHGFESHLRYGKDFLAAHIIGYTSSDSSGVCGIEKEFDSELKTDSSLRVSYFSDALGSPVGDVMEIAEEADAKNIVMTLDSRIQKITEQVMDEYVKKGAVVIMDVESFDIIACASRPVFNPSEPWKYLDSENGELLNRAFLPYNAGSVFKIVTACAALENNIMDFGREIFCAGYYSPDEKSFFSCHKKEGHQSQTFCSAFAKSCNCFFYETALLTGGKKISEAAHALGLGKKVLLNDMNESEGYIPEKEEYTPYELINIGIGQGDIMITPLQCTQMTAIIANGGVKKQTNLVKSLVNSKKEALLDLHIESSDRVISSHTASLVGSMMRSVVENGTAKKANECKIPIAGKTGSAETGWQNSDGSFKVHGWFCGYFPYDNPKYAMTVFCEDGKSGAGSCVEPFVKIAEKIMR